MYSWRVANCDYRQFAISCFIVYPFNRVLKIGQGTIVKYTNHIFA